MNNFEDTYTFGENADMEQASDSFNFNDISGLGESNYDNPDLFETSVDEEVINDNIKDKEETQPFYIEQPITTLMDDDDELDEGIDLTPFSDIDTDELEEHSEEIKEEPSMPFVEQSSVNDQAEEMNMLDKTDKIEIPIEEEKEQSLEEIELDPVIDEQKNSNDENIDEEQENLKDENIGDELEEAKEDLATEEIKTKDEELKYIEKIEDFKSQNDLTKLTEYEEPEIEITDINGLFDKVNVNVKEASDIFRRNTEMKDKIDSRFNELKKLQSEIEKSKQENIKEVDKYKEEVVQKLTSKKNEIEERLNVLKNLQVELENEKKEFEIYKKEQTELMEKTKENIENAYDDRKKELNHIEDILRKQKDSLDEQRNELSLDRIQYEADKNELANNLLKFNELVNSFTNGVNEAKGE